MAATTFQSTKGLFILHLSDLHFAIPKGSGHYWNSEATELQKPEHDRRGLVRSVVDDLEHQRIRPGLVVVSGDLLDRAAPAGIPLAKTFLADLCRHLSIPRSNCVLVPGNHDVIHGANGAPAYERFDEIWREFYGQEQTALIGKEGHERVVMFDYPRLGLQILGFNSCEQLTAGGSQGAIGDAQRSLAEQHMAKIGEPRLRIAVMHHHLEAPEGQIAREFSVMQDPQTMKSWLIEHQFVIMLHGHQHVDWQSAVDREDWRLEVTAAGSLGVGSYGRSQWRLPLAYQILVLDSHGAGRRMRREYSEQHCRFGDAAGGTDSKNSPIRTLRFGAPNARGAVRRDLREFLPDFERLLNETLEAHRPRIDVHKAKVLRGEELDFDELIQDILELYPLHSDRQADRFGAAAKNLVLCLAIALEAAPSDAAASEVAAPLGQVARAPVTTYLFVAILMAQGQGSRAVSAHYDEGDGQSHGDEELPEDQLAFCPTTKDALKQFEKTLWRVLLKKNADGYAPACSADHEECLKHRIAHDQLERCNLKCHRYLLYYELAGFNEKLSGHLWC